MQLVWTNSGDTLSIIPHNSQLIEYWLGELADSGINSFEHNGHIPHYRLDKFSHYVREVNQYLRKFDLQLPEHEDWLDQDNLNDIHRTYVKHQQGRNIVELMRRIGGEEAVHLYRQVNQIIHETERTVQYYYTGAKHWSCPNPFGTDILEFGRWQVELHYESLGRATYEKWINYDNNFVDVDTDDFAHLGSRLQFNIGRPLRMSPPEDYLIACAGAGCKPVGEVLPIGNFHHPIGTIRALFHRNTGSLTLHT